MYSYDELFEGSPKGKRIWKIDVVREPGAYGHFRVGIHLGTVTEIMWRQAKDKGAILQHLIRQFLLDAFEPDGWSIHERKD
jgi:hypothetical protein